MNMRTRLYLALMEGFDIAIEAMGIAGNAIVNTGKSMLMAGGLGVATCAVCEISKAFGAPISIKDGFTYAGYVLVGVSIPAGIIRTVRDEYESYRATQRTKPPELNR